MPCPTADRVREVVIHHSIQAAGSAIEAIAEPLVLGIHASPSRGFGESRKQAAVRAPWDRRSTPAITRLAKVHVGHAAFGGALGTQRHGRFVQRGRLAPSPALSKAVCDDVERLDTLFDRRRKAHHSDRQPLKSLRRERRLRAVDRRRSGSVSAERPSVTRYRTSCGSTRPARGLGTSSQYPSGARRVENTLVASTHPASKGTSP